jgi:outer membrane protein assembly factor BamE (lipoprotein component of BamABCDE complex)
MRKINITEGMRCVIVFTVPLLTIFISMLLFSGCATTKMVKQNSEVKVEEPNSANIKSQSLSYGMVTSKVKKGITTQQEILELFGGPNITTLTSEGEESYVYEYTSSSSETKETSISAAKQFDIFFGLGLYGSKSGEEEKRITVARSIKTLTVIIKFNQDKTVAEYSARASYF